MANVMFKKGLLSKLPSTYSEGTFYVTTDERAIYLDVSDQARIRLGDFQEFDSLSALRANTNPSTTALYYITDINCLAKWNGADYIQINLDTGATSVEAIGEGNAITGVSYNSETRKITFTKDATYATPDEVTSAIDTKTGILVYNDNTYATVKEYVDAKTSGIATDAALSELQSKVSQAESDIDALEAKVGSQTVEAQINAKIEALDLANTYEEKGAAATALGEAKAYADGKDAAIQAAQEAADGAQSEIDALEQTVGTVAEGKTVVQMIEEAQAAATYDDTALAQRVTDAEAELGALIGEDTNKSVRAIANEELAAQLIPENAKEALNSLEEIAAWIQAHPDDASAMNAAIVALQEKVDTGDKTVSAYVTDAITAIGIGDYAKADELLALAARVEDLETDTHTHSNKDLLDTYAQTEADLADAVAKKHEHANAAVLNGIDEAKVTAWDGAEQAAKDYADSLAENYDSAGSASAAEQAAKDYADGLAENYDSAGSASAAEQAAKDYADSLILSWGEF